MRQAPVNNDRFPGRFIAVLHLKGQRAVLGLLGFACLAALGIIGDDLKSLSVGVRRSDLLEDAYIRLNIIPVIIFAPPITQNHGQMVRIIGICHDQKVFNVCADDIGTQLERATR